MRSTVHETANNGLEIVSSSWRYFFSQLVLGSWISPWNEYKQYLVSKYTLWTELIEALFSLKITPHDVTKTLLFGIILSRKGDLKKLEHFWAWNLFKY